MHQQFRELMQKRLLYELLDANPGGLTFREIRCEEPLLNRRFLNTLSELTGRGCLIEHMLTTSKGPRTRYLLGIRGRKELAEMREQEPNLQKVREANQLGPRR